MTQQVNSDVLEIYLNGFGQPIQEKIISETEVNSRLIIEVYVATGYLASIDSFAWDKILEIKNYGDHVRVQEFYKSFLGELAVDKILYGVKPTDVLKMLFPNLYFNK